MENCAPQNAVTVVTSKRLDGGPKALDFCSTAGIAAACELDNGWGDVAIGVTALPVVWLVARRVSGSHATALAWNLLGFADLVVAPDRDCKTTAINLRSAFPLD